MKGFLTAISALFIAAPLFADTLLLDGKHLNFYVEAEDGSFYIQDPAPDTAGLKYLLFKDSPATSYPTFFVAEKPYRANDGDLEVIQYLSEDGENTISGIYEVDDIRITLSYVLTNESDVSGSGSGDKNVILVMVSYENLGDITQSCGLRVLYDTYYNERWGDPFIYDSSTELYEYERRLPEASMPSFFYSGLYDIDDGFYDGLFIYPYLNEIHPDAAIVGNWKKLDETEDEYEVTPQDKFKYNSYSNKDAAVAFFFESIDVNPGETVTFGNILTRKDMEFDQYIGTHPIADVIDAVTSTAATTTTTVAATTTTIAEAAVSTTTTLPLVTTTTVPVQLTSQNYAVTNYVFSTNEVSLSAVNELLLLEAQMEVLERLTALVETLEETQENFNTMMTQTIATTSTTIPSSASETNDATVYLTADEIRDLLAESSVDQNSVINQTCEPETVYVEIDNSEDLEALKSEYESLIVALESEYQSKLNEQQEKYDDDLKQIERDLTMSMSAYSRNLAMHDIDEILSELDARISVIEQLERLKLDFESMPESEILELYENLEELESEVYQMSLD